MADKFKALILSQADDKIENQVTELSVDDLPEGDVLVRVEYSDVNYKDGMVVNGIGGLVRDYPHVPGIDFAGVVEESSHARFKIGDKVVLTGWRVGEVHWGGYAQKARVNGDWLVALPDGLSTRQAMAVGTAGLTSMLCVKALEDHGITPADGPVLVTGAAGGVGSVAVAILARLGYSVGASTGREALHDYLKSLGAAEIVP
ncbi:MAG: alcohol dehydrogenase catalytic domain-containing protein, partial [Pseudomonadota bacterium]|nr:alcohol dehydrogenase catalytic domain-containing protein [Pseudomonadota bacterium]